MLEKLKNCTKSLSKIILITFVFSSKLAFAVNGYIPVDDTHLRLSDGREIFSIRKGDHSHQIVLKRKNAILWQKTFEYEYDRLWDYAFFVPVKKDHLAFDLNGNGNPKVAIATWDGGNAMDRRTAIIFEVTADALKYYDTQSFNLEYGRYVYP
jgi:hypothetical protein